MTFYIFSQGTLSSADEVNYNLNKTFKLQSEKAINDVSATNSGVLAGSSQVLIDKFLDANGQNNTVDTGTTTATHNSSIYVCSFTNSAGSAATQTASGDMTLGGTVSNYYGMKILANANCTIVNVIKDSGCTATKAYLKTASGEIIATATFSTHTATFSPEPQLIAGVYYYMECGKDGSSYSYIYNAVTYPVTNTLINFIEGSRDGTLYSTSTAYNFLTISAKPSTLTFSDALIQSSVATVPTGMTKCFITPLMYEALSGSDAITVDLSIDNGSNYTTGIPVNTWSPITSANGTQLIVKMNLNTASGVSSPKILGWRCLLE